MKLHTKAKTRLFFYTIVALGAASFSLGLANNATAGPPETNPAEAKNVVQHEETTKKKVASNELMKSPIYCVEISIATDDREPRRVSCPLPRESNVNLNKKLEILLKWRIQAPVLAACPKGRIVLRDRVAALQRFLRRENDDTKDLLEELRYPSRLVNVDSRMTRLPKDVVTLIIEFAKFNEDLLHKEKTGVKNVLVFLRLYAVDVRQVSAGHQIRMSATTPLTPPKHL